MFCVEEVTDARLKIGLRFESWFNLYDRVFIFALPEKKLDINECLCSVWKATCDEGQV